MTSTEGARSGLGTRHDDGRSVLQYIGMVGLAAVIVGGVFAAAAPDTFRDSFTRAVCVIIGQNCGDEAGGATGPGPELPPALTPLEQATQGTVWFGGDSYASGEGIGTYDPETNVTTWRSQGQSLSNKCHRSPGSYQAQVFSELQGMGYFAGQEYSSNACSGAITSDLYQSNHSGNVGEGPQGQQSPTGPDDVTYDKIPDDASLISLSMGGNDLGFADVLTNCVSSWIGEGCRDTALIEGRAQRFFGTPGSMGELEAQIQRIKEKHPDARIIIMGYPPLFAERKSTWFIGVDEQQWANEMSRMINRYLRDMAERQGVEFVDPTSAFVGDGYDHRIGSDDEWINGVGLTSEACHPNQKGHDAMAALLLRHIKEGP